MAWRKNNNNKKNKGDKKEAPRNKFNDLDRFAGSSEEEVEPEEPEVEEEEEELSSDDDNFDNEEDITETRVMKEDVDDNDSENDSMDDGSTQNAPKKSNSTTTATATATTATTTTTTITNGEDADASSLGEEEYEAESEVESYDQGEENDEHVQQMIMDPSMKRQKRPGQIGMADAMSRILGFSTAEKDREDEQQEDDDDDDGDDDQLEHSNKKKTKPSQSSQLSSSNVILSKTITPLQKLQNEMKEQEETLRNKRKERREVNLLSMHIPLSAATSKRPIHHASKKKKNKNKSMSTGSMDGVAMAKELEVERMHRRVATRGVVALFNTITKHQQQKIQQQLTSTESKKTKDLQKLSKHGFLDALKTSTSSSITNTQEAGNNDTDTLPTKEIDISKSSNQKKSSSSSSSSSGWNALKDDFMMNSQLKDWDKEISEDEDDSDGNIMSGGDDDDSDDGVAGGRGGRGGSNKRDLDDGIEGEWSSDEEEETTPSKRRKFISA